ncbi:MAG: hypothetical protein OEY20_03440 [Gemmatimonadota bacterium]|nr:hypothetical protein [Gemmatimonadota bacterium]
MSTGRLAQTTPAGAVGISTCAATMKNSANATWPVIVQQELATTAPRWWQNATNATRARART